MDESLVKEVEAGLVKSGEVADQIMPAMSKLIEKISPAIATLSDKLGTTAEHLWIILVKQSYNYAIGNLVILIFTAIALYVAFYGAGVWKKKIEEEEWDADGWGGIIAIKIVALILSTIIITVNVINLAHRLINPEYYALQKVLDYIK